MSKVFFSSDGTVGISVELSSAILRFFEKPPEGKKPKYQGVARIENWTDDVAAIKAAHGVVVARHMALIVEVLHKANFKWLFTERMDGNTPLSKVILDGPLAGWFLTDIDKALARARRRYPNGCCSERDRDQGAA